jgi:hypothetical protein
MNPMMGNMNNMGMMGNMNNMNNMNKMMMNNMNNMNGMNMNNMNPMMMNNMNNMNLLMMGGAGMNMGMNPMMGGMGNNMNMMGMGMNPMMGGMGMNQNMTPEEYKQQQKYLGYLYGKKLAEERKKEKEKAQGSQTTPASSTTNTAPANETSGEISIKFKKGGNTKTIKMNSSAMVAELINEYCVKTNNQGTFSFKGTPLDPNDFASLADKGMKNGDEIIVS